MNNPSLREALRRCTELGLSVRQKPHCGELIVGENLAPALTPVVVNQRRRDTPRKLLVLLRRAEALRREPSGGV